MEVFLVYHLIATAQGEPHSMHHAIMLNKQGCELAARDTEMDLAETAEPIEGVYLRRNVVDFPNRRWKEKRDNQRQEIMFVNVNWTEWCGQVAAWRLREGKVPPNNRRTHEPLHRCKRAHGSRHHRTVPVTGGGNTRMIEEGEVRAARNALREILWGRGQGQ